MNAVYAAALGVDAALRNLCGNNYTEVCPNYRSSSTRSQLTLDGIRAARYVAVHICYRGIIKTCMLSALLKWFMFNSIYHNLTLGQIGHIQCTLG